VVALTGDASEAETLAAEALEITRTLGLRLFVVMALTRAAEVAIIAGRIDQARDTLVETLALLREVGGQAWVSDVLELGALVGQADGRTNEAAHLLGAADQLSGERPTIRALRHKLTACRADVARQLGSEAFALASRGHECSVDSAIADALATLDR
jgi:hypothetical protein